MMRCNERGIEIIKKWEGFRPTSYLCLAKKRTIGYGHFIKPGEEFQEPMSREIAYALLLKDLREVEVCLDELIEVILTRNEFSALCCLVFNIGVYAFSHSPLVRNINLGLLTKVADEILLWNKITGEDGIKHESKGILNRRKEERELFLTVEVS